METMFWAAWLSTVMGLLYSTVEPPGAFWLTDTV